MVAHWWFCEVFPANLKINSILIQGFSMMHNGMTPDSDRIVYSSGKPFVRRLMHHSWLESTNVPKISCTIGSILKSSLPKDARLHLLPQG